jgi:hypothetical protein
LHFNYARLEGILVADDPNQPAVAEQMFPEEINSTVQVSWQSKLSPKFSFHELEIEPVTFSQKKDYILYEPQILALHIGTPKPAWSLKSTSSKSIAGMKHFFLIASKAEGSDVHLKLNVGGRVQTNFGPIPIAWTKKDDVARMIIKI